MHHSHHLYIYNRHCLYGTSMECTSRSSRVDLLLTSHISCGPSHLNNSSHPCSLSVWRDHRCRQGGPSRMILSLHITRSTPDVPDSWGNRSWHHTLHVQETHEGSFGRDLGTELHGLLKPCSKRHEAWLQSRVPSTAESRLLNQSKKSSQSPLSPIVNPNQPSLIS